MKKKLDIQYLRVKGASVHNLKNISLEIPRNKLIVFTGKSGSGKSSLAFDTIYAEGQRRYLDTFNAYARQFIGTMNKPNVESITGLSPVVAIEQKTTSKNPRSTVGTITEIYDYLRLLYSRIGEAYSYITGKKMVRFSDQQILNLVKSELDGKKIIILSPIIRSRKGHYAELFYQLAKKKYLKVRINGKIHDITPTLKLDRYQTHDIEVVVDRLKVVKENDSRLSNSFKHAMDEGNGVMMIIEETSNSPRFFSRELMCLESGVAYDPPEPNSFSFNSPKGACNSCNGLGYFKKVDIRKIIPNDLISINKGAISPISVSKPKWILDQITLLGKKYDFNLNTPIKLISKEGIDAILYGDSDSFVEKLNVAGISKTHKISFEGIVNFIEEISKQDSMSIQKWASKYMTNYKCKDCNGSRLNKQSSNYRVVGKTISDLCMMDIRSLYDWLSSIEVKLNDKQRLISKQIFKEIIKRVEFILDVGLSYLSLNRSTKSLSGGEAQRIRLATQIGTQLTNVLYILDEPSIGLHQRDNLKLIDSLKKLRDLDNTVIVVEHDKDMIKNSDFIVDLGPEAGVNGGEIVFAGKYENIIDNKYITSDYLCNRVRIEIPNLRRKGNGNFLSLYGAKGNNLKNIDVRIPLGVMCCITGVSGSGKSTLVNETIYPLLNKHFYRGEKEPLEFSKVEGIEYLDKVIAVDQSPIGRTPRSNPATYTSFFTDIRKLFAELSESKVRGYGSGRFSFNVVGGRCEVCKGAGVQTIEMNFLPNVSVTCKDCNGKRYNSETLEIKYKGLNISEILNLTIDQAVDFFKNIPNIFRKIKTLKNVGLGYLTLGQSATTLSGGEAQRIKLSAELSKKSTGKTLYILDEPTTGLHFEDIKILLKVLNSLISKGNTVLVIEHNLDVIKVSDYIIDLGPEGGQSGGELVCNGTPEDLVKCKDSHTGKYLVNELI
ncbi:MAG: excinuclease ABC subunit A [Flavobacteriales bacterium]|nr:excinuclease ABC subunit A [Flavobacteriales bacterium]